MQYWRLFWITVFYSFGQQIQFGCCQRAIKCCSNSHRSTRDVSSITSSNQRPQSFSTTEVSIPPFISYDTQEMARTFPSSLSKYLSLNKQHKHKKPKFRPVYSNRRKSIGRTSLATQKNATKYKKSRQQLAKTKATTTKPNKVGPLAKWYAFFSGIDDPIKALRRADLDASPADGNPETDVLNPEAESRTGIILASAVGLAQAFSVVSTSIGLGSVIMMVLALLVKIAIKGILAALLTIYLL